MRIFVGSPGLRRKRAHVCGSGAFRLESTSAQEARREKRMEYSRHPRPDFERAEFRSLDGVWSFRFDEEEERPILVPFAHQCAKSGIGVVRDFRTITYRRRFEVPGAWREGRVLLHFGAVDYYSRVYVNGNLCCVNEGGSTGFSADVTDRLCWGEEEIVVVCRDPQDDETIPRGKQSWTGKPERIWYTNTSGIWQSVYIEPVGANRIEKLRFTPDIDSGSVSIELETLEKDADSSVEISIGFEGETVFEGTFRMLERHAAIAADLFNRKIFRTGFHKSSGWCWTPETPRLFDVRIVLHSGGAVQDRVSSYFGMRKVSTRKGLFLLNDKPYYQRLILDQGYFPESLMTPGSLEELERDISLAKEMGFNGCRKHQKSEDPRFLYLADKLGYLVWSEVPSCPSFSGDAVRRITDEWFRMLERDYNHPSIVAYVALNESWGVPNIGSSSKQRNHAKALYHTIKSIDDTRLVISNDGWEATGYIKRTCHFIKFTSTYFTMF